MYIKRFKDIFEAVAIHKDVRIEKLPHSSEMEARGYRIANIGNDTYAFHKDYYEDDDIYWLGENTDEYRYGSKYLATPVIVSNKKDYPFYAIYCKCDPSPTDAQKKVIEQREKENKKRQQELQKEIRGKKKK